MSVTAKVYGLGMKGLLSAQINWASDSMKVMLCTSSYAPNQDTHEYKSDVTNEVTGTGYTAGGLALTTKTITYDGTTNTLTLDCDDPSWAASTITARYAVFYDATPSTDATRPLLLYWDFGTDFSSSSGAFTLTVNASGLLTLTTA